MGRRDRVKLAEEKSVSAESGGRPCLERAVSLRMPLVEER
jgi:hypothetical protein